MNVQFAMLRFPHNIAMNGQIKFIRHDPARTNHGLYNTAKS